MHQSLCNRLSLLGILFLSADCAAQRTPAVQGQDGQSPLAACSRQAGPGFFIDAEPITRPPFSGNLAFVGSEDRLVPLVDATFWCLTAEAPGCESTSGPVPITLDPNGKFRSDLPDDMPWRPIFAVYTVRANGCDDTPIYWGPDWVERTIVVSCPGRTDRRP